MGGRCAAPAAVLAWGGLVMGAAWLRAPLAIAVALAGGVVLALAAVRLPPRVGTLAAHLGLALVALSRGGAHPARLAAERAWIAPDRPYWFVARVVEPPLREGGAPLAVVAIERSSPPLPCGARLRLVLPPGCAAEWGDRCRALARLERPSRPRNPGGFDPRAVSDAAGLAGSGVARYVEVVPAHDLGEWPRGSVMRWRRGFERRAHAALSAHACLLALPLALGDRSALPPDLDAAFRASGLVHVLALSGMHVTWMAAVARGLVAACGAGVAGRAWARLACAVLYVALAGPLPALVRAATGEVLGAWARLTGRALDPLQGLAVGALAVLAARPGWSLDLGFQLSSAATLGLITVSRAWRPASAWAQRMAAAFAPTLGAQCMATPLLLARAHAFSWVAPFANLFAVPISGLLLVATWLALIVDAAWPGTAQLLFSACDALAAAFAAVVDGSARMPGALVVFGDHPAFVTAAALGAALAAWGSAPRRAPERPWRAPRREAAAWTGVGLAVVAIGVGAALPPLAPPPGHFWCVALDVGQGDAIAVAAADGWRLVDAGGRTPRFDAGNGVVVPFLRWAGVRRLESLALTHDDADHVGGAASVMRAVACRAVWVAPSFPGAPGPGPRFAAPAGRRLRAVARGDLLPCVPEWRVLWPPRAGPGAALERPLTSADNAAALVIEIGDSLGAALLMADADSVVEESLAVAGPVALLKVGHHGSASSTGVGLLARVKPRFAVISVGSRNRFGHPAPVTLGRLESSGAFVSRTDRDGAIWFDVSASGARPLDWRRAAGCAGRGAGGSDARIVRASPVVAPRMP
ncbi:MAG TPA: ComEC/Rec2 family competence protein [Candidatus Saccharimonadaceae bacterium]|jgi:competence protein ComEC|nr:ComEC/Rec2 family competence protein [Candidatus Saccharimonadaceae bacterium]